MLKMIQLVKLHKKSSSLSHLVSNQTSQFKCFILLLSASLRFVLSSIKKASHLLFIILALMCTNMLTKTIAERRALGMLVYLEEWSLNLILAGL
jgi:hypothetical protein